jgi:hypothetical protein
MSEIEDGWAGVVADGQGWRAVTSWENRHSIALMDAHYSDEATHVGYFNGRSWEDVEPIDAPNGITERQPVSPWWLRLLARLAA